jgi:hypothetical protein
VPAIAFVSRASYRLFATAAGALFALFVVAKGIPTLRHDWTWPIDGAAIPSFLSDAVNGWISASLGMPNPHPTTYLIALPIAAAMWLFGTLGALALFAAVIGYTCVSCSARIASSWSASPIAAWGIGLFALFNPWVYNEVVAGHLVMVLAYGGFIGMLAEMLRGRRASMVRLALWIALIEAQLQFFIAAMVALTAFAAVTRKWLAPALGVLVAMPSIVGLIAERATLLETPYGVTWQTNQSVAPAALLSLGGYFPGYADRLGVAAAIAIYSILALALVGAFAARRTAAAIATILAAALLYVVIVGMHGPGAAAYAWIVRNVPESGVFRELYDLTGLYAALLALLACAASARVRALGYVAFAAGLTLVATWALHPPSDLWISARAYPHPAFAAAPLSRVALLPAFQPLALRAGGGDGADPDAFTHPGNVGVLNAYLPEYPVDMALGRYEQSATTDALRALGVTAVVPRPWLVSRTRGAVGLAATSLEPPGSASPFAQVRGLRDAMPLVSACGPAQIVGIDAALGTCGVFFGDAPGYAPLHPIVAPSDSIDPQTAWIDARLAFAESPALAQAVGGALTQSAVPLPVAPNSWLLAYVRGALIGSGGQTLAKSAGAFAWLYVPYGVVSARCAGLCELVAQTARRPHLPSNVGHATLSALRVHRYAPWLYVVDGGGWSGPGDGLLRFNERYDSAWAAFSAGRTLAHVRMDAAVNGWALPPPSARIVIVELTALVQSVAEVVGVLCVLWLLKAAWNVPTKRAP